MVRASDCPHVVGEPLRDEEDFFVFFRDGCRSSEQPSERPLQSYQLGRRLLRNCTFCQSYELHYRVT